jgi:HSP20 family protein
LYFGLNYSFIFVPSQFIFPREDNNEVALKAKLPGMTKEDIDVMLTDDTITLSGGKKKEEKVEKDK